MSLCFVNKSKKAGKKDNQARRIYEDYQRAEMDLLDGQMLRRKIITNANKFKRKRHRQLKRKFAGMIDVKIASNGFNEYISNEMKLNVAENMASAYSFVYAVGKLHQLSANVPTHLDFGDLDGAEHEIDE